MIDATVQNRVLIIGGGIAGITAASDLEDKGFKVYLVERSPSIGGHMAQLDKTFPTLDCSICILAPKMVEVARHPNTQLITYSEVKEVKRSADGTFFTVRITKKPRYVDENKCVGCGLCTEKCPAKTQNEFEAGLMERKAIYIPFPQAVPAIATIDENACLNLTKGVCRVCEKACPAEAIDFDQKAEELSIQVSSIIVATGYDLLDSSPFTEYGFRQFPDVLYSMQYERMMNAAGPTGGKIVRISDSSKPKRILFIQCVGSRSQKPKRKSYCSQVCCMYATKQAIVTKEHEPEIEVAILYNDLRVSGKGYEELVKRAKEEFKINYLKGLPGGVQRDPLSGRLVVRHMDISSGEMREVQTDLVVLCPAMIPTKNHGALAKKLGIEVDEFGFHNSSVPLFDVATNVPGIFICGCMQRPKDISHSVIQAHAATTEALLRALPFSPLVEPKVEGKTEVSRVHSMVEPRTGVFVCHCGLNIANVVDVKEVTEYAKTLPNVTYAEDLMYTCSKDGTEHIKKVIVAEKLNRVVVAACTPTTHAPLFRSICREAGLNPYLFEMINIREHASWVHKRCPEEATEKAKDLVRMGVIKSTMLEPLEELSTSITPSALIVGGSVAGLVCSKVIADAGFKVLLVEKSEKLSGSLFSEYPHMPFRDVNVKSELEKLVKAVEKHGNIDVILSSKPTEFKGSIGHFEVSIQSNPEKARRFEVGVAIIAPDAVEMNPQGLYGYGSLDSVYTVSEFRRIMETEDLREHEVIGFIICGGSERCCAEALDSALIAKKSKPASNVYIFYEDIRLPLEGERFYRKARELGIIFIRFDEMSKPRVYMENKKKIVEAYDLVLRERISLPVDKLVLSVPLIAPEEADGISHTFKVPLNEDGFFLEIHPKMRPIDFSSEGLFMAGMAHSPQSLEEAATQGLAAASRALTPLVLGELTVEPRIATVDYEKCTGCGTCVSICEYNAPKMVQLDHGRMVAEIDPILCKGCGTCATDCPGRAIEVRGFTRAQTMAMIRAALAEPSPDRPKVIAFLCNWCAYAGANAAGVSRFQYPPAIRIVRTMCSGMVDPFYVLYSFMQGADGVLIGGCKKGDCHYIFGNLEADEALGKLKEMLKTTMIDPKRFLTLWISAGEGKIFAEKVAEFTEKLESLGPSPYKKR
ncbi:MAG: hydrogenase iron-sulfur subunit [Candidatus Bathyarchaeota archaeon]|nr:MAG: hydrogenase iron-sulfur subunit [Candidatus Bathyarchaeota archaeon]